MSPREPSLLNRLDSDAYVVEVAALLDVLGIEHEAVRLGIPRSKAALFVQDLRKGQAARDVVRSSPSHVLLPDHVEATVLTRPGVTLRVAGWIARAIAHDLDVGRRIRLGPPVVSPAPRLALAGQKLPAQSKPFDGLSSQA